MGGFHVLVATTIIENGIDIPNVNSIIIDRADMYGVSQLYQLRGRVGRSDKKAYAYLLYPENKALSEVAMKRLQVISDFTELGSGFKIAMKDMEIRGAGNLLGRDQSGDVYAVGFDLYVRLLNDAVHNLMAQKDYQETVTEVLMDLEYTGFIPETYVQNPQTKMEIYKKIAAITTDNEFENVVFELEAFSDNDEKSFIMALLLGRIYEHRQVEYQNGKVPGNTLRHIVVLEEAHRLLAKAEGKGELQASPRTKSVEIFSDMLAEVRAYGQGMIIVDQIPSKLTPEVMKNTEVKIAHRLLSKDDREAVGATMNLSKEQIEDLARHDAGEATMYFGNLANAHHVKIKEH
jgi:hypothetical protein